MDKRKNKVYFAMVDDDYGGVYIASNNIKNAEGIARCCDLISEHIESYIDLRIHMCRDSEGNIVRTDYEGELDIEQIVEVGLAWFGCMNDKCGSDDIEIIEWDAFKCKKCGQTFDVPYVN